MVFLFEELKVYKRALIFVEQIIDISKSLPKGHYYLVDQLRRAAISIPANIAEGNGRWHGKDRRQFFIIARGSAFECLPLIDIFFRLELITKEQKKRLRGDLEILSKMLSSLASKQENRK